MRSRHFRLPRGFVRFFILGIWLKKFRKIVRNKINEEFLGSFSTQKQRHARSDEVLERGGADFCEPHKNLTLEEKVLGYCHRYFQMHYDSSREVFEQCLKDPASFDSSLFVDFGCGPGTSGFAFADFMQGKSFEYIGVDRSSEMIRRASDYFNVCGIQRKNFYTKISELTGVLRGRSVPVVIFNFCFLLGEGTFRGDVKELSSTIDSACEELTPQRAYILYQNPVISSNYHRNWEEVKSLVKGFSSPRSMTQTIDYERDNPVYCDMIYRKSK